MNQDEKDLEKERLELERQKLELEREKFELEKNKTQNPSPKSNGGTTIGDIVGYICSIVLIVAVFLPWVAASSSYGGFSFKASANGLQTGHGFITILCAVSAIVLIAMKKKWALIPIGIALLDAVAVMAGVGSFSASAGGASAKAGFALGPIVVFIASSVMIVSTLLRDKKAGGSGDFAGFIKKNKFELLLGLFLILLFVPILFDDFHLRKFKDLLTALFFACIIPGGILFYLKLKRSFIAFAPLCIFYILGYILSYNPHGFGGMYYLFESGNSSSLLFPSLAFHSTLFWFNFIFYPVLIIILIYEVWSKKGIDVIPESVTKYFKFITPKFYYPILFGPFVVLAAYNMLTKHLTTIEEQSAFYSSTGQIEGNWYFINEDTTEVYLLQIDENQTNPFSSIAELVEEQDNGPDFSGNLSSYFQYRVLKFEDPIMSGHAEYTAQYDELLKFPYSINDSLTIIDVGEDILEIEIMMPGSKKGKYKCVNSRDDIKAVYDAKQERIMAEMARLEMEENLDDSYFFSGTWEGEMNNKPFSIIIENVTDNTITGYNILDQNQRPLEGNYVYTEIDDRGKCVIGITAVLNEPGDDEWDGVFEITFVGYEETEETEYGTIECIGNAYGAEAVGTWKSNNGKSQHEFTLNKRN